MDTHRIHVYADMLVQMQDILDQARWDAHGGRRHAAERFWQMCGDWTDAMTQLDLEGSAEADDPNPVGVDG